MLANSFFFEDFPILKHGILWQSSLEYKKTTPNATTLPAQQGKMARLVTFIVPLLLALIG
jgi:hypothetical protein